MLITILINLLLELSHSLDDILAPSLDVKSCLFKLVPITIDPVEFNIRESNNTCNLSVTHSEGFSTQISTNIKTLYFLYILNSSDKSSSLLDMLSLNLSNI